MQEFNLYFQLKHIRSPFNWPRRDSFKRRDLFVPQAELCSPPLTFRYKQSLKGLPEKVYFVLSTRRLARTVAENVG